MKVKVYRRLKKEFDPRPARDWERLYTYSGDDKSVLFEKAINTIERDSNKTEETYGGIYEMPTILKNVTIFKRDCGQIRNSYRYEYMYEFLENS